MIVLLVAVANCTWGEVIFYDDCTDTNAWSGTGLNYITLTNNMFVFNSTTDDPNLNIATTNFSLTTHGDITISFTNGRHDTGWHETSAYMQVGLGNGLAIRYTPNGIDSTESKLLYNGTDYLLDYYPQANWGNMAIKIEYYSENKRVVTTMITGTYVDPATSNRLAANNTIIYDNTFATSLDVSTYNRLEIHGAAQYSGGLDDSKIDNINLTQVHFGTVVIVN